PQHDILGLMGQNTAEPKVCRWVGGLGHELGHALGLSHPVECDSHQSPDNSFPCQSLMYLGYLVYPNTYFLPANIDALNQSPFIAARELDGPPVDCSILAGEMRGPLIDGAVLIGKKLTVTGERFGSTPRVFINGVDRTGFLTSASDATIRVKAKQKKLGFHAG